MTTESKITKKIKPIGTGVLVLIPAIKTTSTFLPDSVRKEMQTKLSKPLRVVEVGDLVKSIFPGSDVLIKNNANVSILEDYDTGLEDFEYAIINLHDIQAVVSDFS